MSLYKGLDAEALEANYYLLARIGPRYPAMVERMATPSAAHREAMGAMVENRNFKRPFGVEGEVSNGGPAKLGLLIAATGGSGVGVDLL